jgi:hypothetical protein
MVAVDGSQGKKYRFVQLYTSKSYENRRSELVNPPETENPGMRRSSSTEEMEKHALSPRLVDAISKTAQVVWANTKKQEGLIGRSEMRLQTAVGMPVAVDARGNMCIVVMFSPNNVQSTDDAMEYLQSISQSATSSSIPCLLPVFDPRSSGMRQLPPSDSHVHLSPNTLGEGVTARFVSFDDTTNRSKTNSPTSEPEVHSEHELLTAPKDTFGIPMLPMFAELDGSIPEENADVFDEASYGVWTTIMDTLSSSDFNNDSQNFDLQKDLQSGSENLLVDGETLPEDEPALQVVLPEQVAMSGHRRERLEEFCLAFLGMSVFDSADVFIPAGGQYSDCLRHVTTVTSTETNEQLNEFKQQSQSALIRCWSGAVGRAFSSGNPVWSANPNVFVDAGRAAAFQQAKILTVLAVPVFSGKSTLPTCVVSCYSLVKSGSVPFVLRFVQQALRLLWDGLDNIEPHGSVGKELWRDIGPADLGEMAADVEMQQHFMTRKRPRSLSTPAEPETSTSGQDHQTNNLSMKLQSVNLPDGETINVPLQLSEDFEENSIPQIKMQALQSHLFEAIRSIGDAVPFGTDHFPTNPQGTKRAHIMGPINGGGGQMGPINGGGQMGPINGGSQMAAPLPPPQPLPSQVVSSSYAQAYQPPQPLPSQVLSSSYAQAYQRPNVEIFHPGHPGAHAVANFAVLTMAQQAFVGAATNPTQYGSDGNTNNNIFCTDGSGFAVGTAAMQKMPPSMATIDTSEQFSLPVDVTSSDCTTEKNCRIQGCCDPAVTRRPYCIKHSGNRLCENAGCNKCAQGSTRFCIAHGGGRRCTFAGCDKGARDKFFCAAHGGGKRCRADGCNKSAVGGSSLCTSHGGGRRCAIDGCEKSAQSSTKFCVKHGGGKKCLHEDCEKVARGRTQYCAAHGGGVRCKLEGCNRVAIGRLQLCRAHGGGSRKKGAASSRDSPSLSDDEDDGDGLMHLGMGAPPNIGKGNMAIDHLASV